MDFQDWVELTGKTMDAAGTIVIVIGAVAATV